jgi:hypothetical protein
MTIRTLSVLDISTAHIMSTTNELLQATPLKDWPTFGGQTQYGFFIYAADDYDEDIPPDLWNVMRFAKEKGCDYICLDRDADQYDDLPTYDWDSKAPIFPTADRPLLINRFDNWIKVTAVFFNHDQANQYMLTASPEQGVIATYGSSILLALNSDLDTRHPNPIDFCKSSGG